MQTQLDGADLTCEEMEVFQNDARVLGLVKPFFQWCSQRTNKQTNEQTNERPLFSHAGARRAR